MKIDKLTLDGFLTYKNQKSIDFGKHNFIVGPNGAGKTTIRNGLEWLLTGQTRMIKGSQIAEKYLVNDDPNVDRAEVSGYFRDQDYWAERNITKSRSSRLTAKHHGKEIPGGPKSPTKTESEEALLDGLELNPDLAHYLLDGKDFAELSTGDRAEELAVLFGANSLDEVENKIDLDSLDDQTATILENILEKEDNIEDATDRLVSERRSIKREKKNKETKLSETQSDVPKSFTVFDQEYPGKYALNNITEIEESIEDEKEELASLRGKHDVVGVSLESIEDQIDSIKKKLNDLPDLKNMEDRISSIKGQINSLEGRIDRAETGQTTCVYDSSCECPVDEDDVKEFKSKAKSKIEELSSKKQTLSQNISKAKRLNKKLNGLENKKESAISEDDLEKMDSLEEKIDEAKSEYKKIKRIKDGIEKKEELEQEVEEAESKISSVNDAIEEIELSREEVLNEALESYRDYLAEASNIFNEQYKLTDDMDLLMNGRPYYALSQSEKLRLQYMNQIALALVTDAGFFALDEVNTLFGNNRLNLLKLLKHFDDEIDTSLIIMSSDIQEAPLDNSKLIKI